MLERRKIKVTYEIEIEVDTENEIVKEYENSSELDEDLCNYFFRDTLPVMNNGVRLLDFDAVEIEFSSTD